MIWAKFMNCCNRSRPTALLLTFCFLSQYLFGQSETGKRFQNHFLTITILPGWTVERSVDQRLNLVRGKYLLSVDPIFTHAGPITGGRFPEIVEAMPSVEAVMVNVDQPAGGSECSQLPFEEMVVTKAISLRNLYTDSSKTRNGCTFPSNGQPAWFGSYFSGQGSECEYAITLAYDTTDVNALPRKDSLELRQTLSDVVTMLKTLRLKPPIVISRVDPQSAPPGAMVTIYGSGFNIPGVGARVQFSEIPNNPMPAPTIAADGKSLTFQVPTSIDTVSCQAGYIDVWGYCVPIPLNHVDINDCPPLSGRPSNSCGVPVPPATYHLLVAAEGPAFVSSGPVPFSITVPKPKPVSISFMYPNDVVSPGDTITVRGTGFTSSGNAVTIGSSTVSNLSSTDGTTITFQAPNPTGTSFIHGIRIYRASVSNANGESNAISLDYR